VYFANASAPDLRGRYAARYYPNLAYGDNVLLFMTSNAQLQPMVCPTLDGKYAQT
jgi:hypothetical protein